MPYEQQWPPESNTERTDVLPAVPKSRATPGDFDPPTVPQRGVIPPARTGSSGPGRTKRFRKAGIIAGAVAGVLAVLYVVDLLVSQGSLPRGVTVAGVDVGGMSRTAAEQTLRAELEPRLSAPVTVRADDVTETLDPGGAGLMLDWPATLDRAGDQPLNPITRVISLFTSEEVGVATKADHPRLTAEIEALRGKIDREPAEGTIRFEGTSPVAVLPKPGQKLDVAAAGEIVLAEWAGGKIVELPVTEARVRVSADSVHTTLADVARPAVSGPVIVHGDGKNATFHPAAIAKALVFEPTEDGALGARFDQAKVVEALGPQLASTEKKGKDAQIVFAGGRPAVQPSEDGRAIKWESSLGELLDAAKRANGREITAQYDAKPAAVTTEQANQIGIAEVIGEFSTGGFAQDSGVNIRVVAEKVNGAIVKPGETFSLNGFTGPRGAAQGYVEAGVIENGAPAREVGGGISQFATTLYNASYFAGMKDAGHKEHSYYISRYPAAREATVFQDHNGASVIDLRFTNDSQTGVAIETIWTASSITVKLWGTKRYLVESIPGPRHSQTPPPTRPGPAENCHPSNGAEGFTTSDTRVIKDLNGREIRRNTRNVRYNPQPKITCGQPSA